MAYLSRLDLSNPLQNTRRTYDRVHASPRAFSPHVRHRPRSPGGHRRPSRLVDLVNSFYGETPGNDEMRQSLSLPLEDTAPHPVSRRVLDLIREPIITLQSAIQTRRPFRSNLIFKKINERGGIIIAPPQAVLREGDSILETALIPSENPLHERLTHDDSLLFLEDKSGSNNIHILQQNGSIVHTSSIRLPTDDWNYTTMNIVQPRRAGEIVRLLNEKDDAWNNERIFQLLNAPPSGGGRKQTLHNRFRKKKTSKKRRSRSRQSF